MKNITTKTAYTYQVGEFESDNRDAARALLRGYRATGDKQTKIVQTKVTTQQKVVR